MYRIFEISYDLRTSPKPNNDALYAELKTFNGWYHVLDSMWFVCSDSNAVEVYNRICRHLKRTDYVWVNEVGDEYYGWLPKGAWKWLASARKQAKLLA